jgi:hypothetical protein
MEEREAARMSEIAPTLGIEGYELRPLSMAETLDTGFQVMKNHFVLLGSLSAIGQIPTVIVFSVFGWMLDPFAFQEGEFPEIGAAFIVGIGIYMLGLLLLLPIVVGAITAAVSDVYLGAEVTLAESLRRGLQRMVPLMLTYLIFTIILFVAMAGVGFTIALLVIGGSAALGDSALGVGLLVVFVLAAIPAAFAISGLLTLIPGILAAVVVLEGRSLFDAIGRTITLVGAQLWRLVAVGVVIWVLIAIVPAGAQFMVGALPVVGAIIWGGVQALCQAYLYATTVVAYFDIRCRLESFDLEHLAQLVEGSAPSAGPTTR